MLRYKFLKHIFFIGFLFSFFSCKKFLNVTPNNNLSGNNYWTSTKDYESYTVGLYNQLRDYLCDQTAFFNVTGEFRLNYWQNVSGQNRGGGTLNNMLGFLKNNDLKSVFSSTESWLDNYGYDKIIDWATWYTIIQSCNILQEQVVDDPNGILSASDKKRYNGEAVFIRDLCYFLMIRIYGDVPYYTDAYNTKSMTRMPMVDVANNCINDLKNIVNDLPWTLTAPTSGYFSTRASKAGVYALIMNLDMWNATFDVKNATKYYSETDSVGNILINDNEGNYAMMPMANIDQSKDIFRGFTKESIFTIPSNYNLGETFLNLAQFGYFTLSGLHYDPGNPTAKSALYMNSEFLTKLYPNNNDARLKIWFGDPGNYSAQDGTFEFYKFYNIDQENGGSTDSKILFRMSDVILLRAEALNNLGKGQAAATMLNLVKDRAGTPPYIVSGSGGESGGVNTDLEEEIIWERLREFVGEGSFFYDAVRTKAIINSKFFPAVMTADAFNLRAWTWPLSTSVRDQNPNITLNTYWQ